MKQIQRMKIHVQCQKNKAIDCEPKRGECRSGRTEWPFSQEDIQGSAALADIPGGFAGRLSLALCRRPIEENQNLAMERPVTLEFCLNEKPEKITAMYLFNDWWTRLCR